ncbi:hypothetical protein BZG36_03358 [Bifiguratus adelaidae]|uniref:Zinc finger CHCC-type domain-containing protein n=1 Tax=Bifiguratus adelaidae TaxID=1938954 RepID=A0A261XWL6_9FUNG|nr:hypothetical protein BZG36_03358 [Bifiguratus adelaidae]
MLPRVIGSTVRGVSSRNRLVCLSSVRLYSTAQPDIVPVPQSPERKLAQSVNQDKPWSKSQRPKDMAMVGPRFEQTQLELQPNSLAAIELIAQEPIRYSKDKIVSCNGGGGALGHPKVYINLDKPGSHACQYCGIRFEKEDHHH